MSATRWLIVLVLMSCASQRAGAASPPPIAGATPADAGKTTSVADGGATGRGRNGGSGSPSDADSSGATTKNGASARIILPVSRARPAGLQPQFIGGGPCTANADCTVSSATGACGPCGGCASAMTKAEADRRERVRCPPRSGPPVACGPCQQGPDRAVCLERECTGLVDPPYDDTSCASDADCVLAAFDGCCQCPRTWRAAGRTWLDGAERFCARQVCAPEPGCAGPPPATSVATCRKHRCEIEQGTPMTPTAPLTLTIRVEPPLGLRATLVNGSDQVQRVLIHRLRQPSTLELWSASGEAIEMGDWRTIENYARESMRIRRDNFADVKPNEGLALDQTLFSREPGGTWSVGWGMSHANGLRPGKYRARVTWRSEIQDFQTAADTPFTRLDHVWTGVLVSNEVTIDLL